MDTALVSICIPAYNSEALIHETIDSLLNQTYKNIEVVIVDDNSTDNTLKKIKEYESKDDRVKVFRNENNLGMSGNWNKCLSYCSGKYIKLCCADDLLREDSIEKEVEILEKYDNVVMVCSDTRLLDVNGSFKGVFKRYKNNGIINGKKLVKKGFFSQDYFGAPQAVTFRKSSLDIVGGFDTYYTYILDYDFFASVAMLGDVYNIHEMLNFFRVRNDSNTGQVMGGDKQKLAIYLDEHRHLFNKQKEALGLSDRDLSVCMMIRRLRCFMAYVYLKVFVRSR